MEEIDCLIVGAGVVGLAIAKRLAESGLQVVVVDAETAVGTHTSSRNSEVLHAGIYYPKGSLKAALCVEGRRMLVDYCRSKGVAHRLCGKLIVASEESQIPALESIRLAAQANGVADIAPTTKAAAQAMEPSLRVVEALHSPSTGIIDSHGLMQALRWDAEASDGVVALETPFLHAEIASDGFVVRLGGSDPMTLKARRLVNSAGLYASEVARRIAGLPDATIPPTRYARGCYFVLSGRSPFTRLIYPIPEPGGLGTHLTLDLGGGARFGPDVEWIDTIDYRLDLSRADRFYGAIRAYWPGLPDDALLPGYTGIRPKLSAPGEPAADFRIDGPLASGIAGLVNLFGIESPGLTSCLAIADRVFEELSADPEPARATA